jgi:hypothetical protein
MRNCFSTPSGITWSAEGTIHRQTTVVAICGLANPRVGRGESAGNFASRALVQKRIKSWHRTLGFGSSSVGLQLDDRDLKFAAPDEMDLVRWNDYHSAARRNSDASRVGTDVVPGLS